MEDDHLRKLEIQYREKTKDLEVISIDLGCGLTKKADHIGIDSVGETQADIFANINEGLPFIPANSVHRIYSRHFLEHLPNFHLLMEDAYRILVNQGRFYAIVPHFSNPYYYSDITHVNLFGLYTFDYFTPVSEQRLKRKVPNFYSKSTPFKVVSRKLRFKSSFFLINLFDKYIMTPIVNISSFTQEFYEGYISKLYGAYEIHYELEKL